MNQYQEQYWRDVDPNSAITKMEHKYWITKQTVLKKIGKKEDECVVASDAELDAKLELFRSIQESCLDLNKIIDRFQDRLCCVAQEENALGRFLKDAATLDKTRAGLMMGNVGRAVSYGGKQRLCVRPALLRLCQEVETFRLRAIADTLANLRAMEKQRAEYRAALRWMKDVSQELDPEHQLDKFRKVQSQVRRSKTRFDQLKLDCLQKVDLLAAARCNMFSHGLVLYHKTMLEFCEKAAHAFLAVANTCKGYQHYEFTVVKELMEPSMRLAEQLNANEPAQNENQPDKDILLFFDPEYRDEETPGKAAGPSPESTKAPASTTSEPLLDLASLDLDSAEGGFPQPTQAGSGGPALDLASSMALLDGLFQGADKTEGAGGADEKWSREWDEVFGSNDSPVKTLKPAAPLGETNPSTSASALCPSHLLDQPPLWLQTPPPVEGTKAHPKGTNLNQASGKSAGNPWLNLFADLDPLADPDAVGARALIDRNC